MKKIYALLIMITILLTACQPTPEREVVINKNQGKFEAAIEATPINSMEQGESSVVSDYIDDPGRWEEYYEKFDGKLKVTIDAEIIIGEIESYPVAKIKPYYVPIEQANKMIEALYGTLDVSGISNKKTKDEIEDMIVQLEFEIQESDKENDAERYEFMKNDLKTLYELMETVPETNEGNKYSGEYDIHKNEDYEEWSIVLSQSSKSLNMHMIVKTPIGNGYTSDIEFGNFAREYTVYTDANTTRLRFDENPVFATDEAKAAIIVAERFLADIGVENRILKDMQMRIYSVASGDVNSYSMYYRKVFDDTNIPIMSNYGGIDFVSEDDYTDIFMPERIMVEVEGESVIGFEWYNAYEIDSILNENIELLPFEEIMANAQSQLAVKYANLNGDDSDTHFYVDKIMLTYVVQPIKDEKYEYILVPAWSFYGGIDYEDGRDLGGLIKTGKSIISGSLLTVNAVDGTVVSKK